MIGLDADGNAVCEPLDSLADVINWNVGNPSIHPRYSGLSYQNIDERKVCHEERNSRPQVLVCHDMKGGYLEDRFLQGSDNSHAYNFYHWHLIDTFVYFSHHFITIPPTGWIRAAHRNGVPILGTIITEWEDGAKICRELLCRKETIDLVAAKLAEIAFTLGFDGWLINIENVIEEKSIPDLQYFVQQVNLQCHRQLTDSAKVLWYDSVTLTGALDWQNALNDKNEMFFSVCDGIFLNYAITDEKLSSTKQKAQAVNRCFDVYVGVDVFGRATPGGGGFNCRQVLELISKHGLSCAIFAQGWVYENHGVESFAANEIKFWSLLREFLPRKAITLPLRTSFCQGFGKRHYLKGKVVKTDPWHNLSLQQIQPWCYSDSIDLRLTTTDAYNGGACLKIEGASTIRLFNLSLDTREKSVNLTAIWKNCGQKTTDFPCGLAFLLLSCEDESESERELEKLSSGKSIILTQENYTALESSKGHNKSLQVVNGSCIGREDDSGWITSEWDINMDWLSKGDKSSSHQNATLCAVLVSSSSKNEVACCQSVSGDRGTQASQSVLIGNLQVDFKTSRQACTIQPNISNVTCVEMNTRGPVTKQNISMVANEVEELRKMASVKFKEVQAASATSSNSPLSSNLTFSDSSNSCCLYKSCRVSSDTCNNGFPVNFHLLNWSTSNSDMVDYYVVFSVDEKGVEHFIGCTSTNFFTNMDDEIKPWNVVGYCIKIVTNNGSLLGQIFNFSIV